MRRISLLAAIVSFSFLPFSQVLATDPIIPVFEITGAGKLFHVEDPVSGGTKPFVTPITAAQIASCITGTPSPCNTEVETDGGGKAYLFLASNHQVFLATNQSCTNSTELVGDVGGDGSFMFSGHHDLSDTDFIVQGSMTLDKTQFPSIAPVAIKKASILAVRNSHNQHWAIGTVKSVVELTTIHRSACP
jgi:hypothetical protein